MRLDYKKLGDYIRPVDKRNTDLAITNILGISVSKKFIPSIANIIGTDLSTYKVVRKGQFAYVPDTSRRGDKICVALLENKDCIVSSSYFPFEVYKTDKLLPEYLKLWFLRPAFDRYARFMSNGSARETFDWECMCNVELPVPSLLEQHKIVRIYNVVADRIELLQKINRNLLELVQAIFKENVLRSNASRLNGTIGDYCTVKSGYAFKSAWWTKEGIEVIKIKSIENGSINFRECSFVSEDKARYAEDFRVVGGDLVIAMTGATLGKFAVVPSVDRVMLVNQRVGKFFLGTNPIMRLPFIYCTLNQIDVINEIINRGQGSAQANISPTDIMNTPCCLPPTDEIEKFNSVCKPLFETIIKLQKENQRLAALRDALLPRLMSSELDVSSFKI